MKLLTKTFMIFILVTNLTPGQAGQRGKHPIDIKVEQCLDIDSNQTTIGMISCIQVAMEEWDAELNKYYRLLIETLKADEEKKLRTAQREWLAYRDKEFEFIETMYGNIQGTMWKIAATDSKNNLVRQRALELISYYDALTFE